MRRNSFRMAVAGLIATSVVLSIASCAGTGASGPARYAIQVDADGYSPSAVKAKPGQEIVLVFTRTTDQTCGTEVIIPSENKTVALPLNEPVEVRLVAKEKGEIEFHCGMKMLEGKVEVQ